MKLFLFDRIQYFRGQVTCFLGDQLTLTGRFVERIGGVDQDLDLTSASVSGFLPAAAGGASGFVCSLEDAACGKILLSVSPTDSATLLASPQGIAPYFVVDGLSESPFTVSTPNPDLVLTSPDFQEPYGM